MPSARHRPDMRVGLRAAPAGRMDAACSSPPASIRVLRLSPVEGVVDEAGNRTILARQTGREVLSSRVNASSPMQWPTRHTRRCRKRLSAARRAIRYSEQHGDLRNRDFALVAVADRKLAVLGGGLGERLLECALAAGLPVIASSGDRSGRGRRARRRACGPRPRSARADGVARAAGCCTAAVTPRAHRGSMEHKDSTRTCGRALGDAGSRPCRCTPPRRSSPRHRRRH